MRPAGAGGLATGPDGRRRMARRTPLREHPQRAVGVADEHERGAFVRQLRPRPLDRLAHACLHGRPARPAAEQAREVRAADRVTQRTPDRAARSPPRGARATAPASRGCCTRRRRRSVQGSAAAAGSPARSPRAPSGRSSMTARSSMRQPARRASSLRENARPLRPGSSRRAGRRTFARCSRDCASGRGQRSRQRPPHLTSVNPSCWRRGRAPLSGSFTARDPRTELSL